MTKTNESERSRRLWIRVVWSVSAVIALSIGGVVYYGTSVLPAENAAKDLASCKTFVQGNNDATEAFLKEGNAKDHQPSVASAMTNYMDIIFATNEAAYLEADKNGRVAQSLLEISKAHLALDTTSEAGLASGFQATYAATTNAVSVCTKVMNKAHVSVPTLDPSKITK